ncbi:MAG: glycosyltransferase [Erysipelotrichaceae bacterium]|nr:glycosyltransferase [Erysipelotrichaceae bacterium]
MDKLVSIVVATYKNIDGLYETLDSIFAQTYGNIEVIITDDGSPNFSDHIEKIESYYKNKAKENITNFEIRPLPVNGGTVKNLNNGLKYVKGDYIMTPAPEDIFTSNESIEHCVSFMENSDFLIAFGKMRGVTLDGEYKYELISCESNYDLLKSYSIEDTLNRLFVRDFLPGPAWIARKELFEKYGNFDEDIRLVEDYPYWLHLALNKVRFGYIDEIVVDYKLSGVSSAGNYSEMFMNDMFKIYDKYIFPNDKRYGIFQGFYNFLKRSGLNYYMSEAKKEDMTPGQRRAAKIKYLPFHIYVSMQNKKVEKKNKRIEKK